VNDAQNAPPMSWPYDAKAAITYGLSLLVTVVGAGWILDQGSWKLATFVGVLAVAIYWRATVIYRKWAIGAEATASGARLGVCAGIGIVFCIGGSVVLAQASNQNSRVLAAIGIALVVVGLMPIMHAIRYEPEPGEHRPWEEIAFGWELNALFAFAALTPGMLILGVPTLIAVLLPSAWLASVAVNRLSRFRCYVLGAVPLLAIGAVGAGIAFMLVPDPGSHVPLVLGLLLACLGCIDAISAPVRRQDPVDWSMTRLEVAAALIVVAFAAAALIHGKVLDHVPFLAVLVVFFAFFAFGGSYIRRGQGLLLLAVLGALTLWVVADRNDPAPRDPTPATEKTGTVVALGDSYASGEGAKMFFAGTSVQGGNQCRRSSDAYGYQVARAFHRHLDFFACSGALGREVWQTAQVKQGSAGDAIGTLPQLENQVDVTPDLVLISIGGNDALFGAVGRGCALPGTCVDIKDIFDGNLGDVRTKVTTALTKVSGRFPDSPIVVVPYPQMLPKPPKPGDELDKGNCDGVPLGSDELIYLHGYVAHLDEQVKRAVVAANAARRIEEPERKANIAYFSKGEKAYDGHSICEPGKGDSAVNTLAFGPTEASNLFDRLVPTSWTHNSFHPKARGHDLLTSALVPWIRDNVPGFGTATKIPATMKADAEAAPDKPGTCTDRDKCTEAVTTWSTGKTIDAIRDVFPFALLLGLLGWLVAAIRRLPVHLPPD
jgi:lysophospholipase L1-like esterase